MKMKMKMRLNINYIFLMLSIILQSFSSVLSKFAATDLQKGDFHLVFINRYYLLAIFFLFLQAIFWQLTLREIDLSIAYPMTALNNIFLLIFSYVIFKEQITFNNILGVSLIVIGIYIQNLKRDSK
jgi:multidrug transporter EmrE-like cation transporter